LSTTALVTAQLMRFVCVPLMPGHLSDTQRGRAPGPVKAPSAAGSWH
jgi:hypothetical protein